MSTIGIAKKQVAGASKKQTRTTKKLMGNRQTMQERLAVMEARGLINQARLDSIATVVLMLSCQMVGHLDGTNDAVKRIKGLAGLLDVELSEDIEAAVAGMMALAAGQGGR